LIISLMYGKSKGKIMADAYTNYPQSARNNAKKVLNWKKESYVRSIVRNIIREEINR
jgi:hypothetical protein